MLIFLQNRIHTWFISNDKQYKSNRISNNTPAITVFSKQMQNKEGQLVQQKKFINKVMSLQQCTESSMITPLQKENPCQF